MVFMEQNQASASHTLATVALLSWPAFPLPGVERARRLNRWHHTVILQTQGAGHRDICRRAYRNSGKKIVLEIQYPNVRRQ